MSKNTENIHSGHRQRLRRQFLDHGLDGLSDVNVLELLLFYAMPQRDTNPIAHRLLDAFGSLAQVLDAPVDTLMAQGGLTENSAALFRLVTEAARRAQISKATQGTVLSTNRKCAEYLLPFFFGLTEETVYVLALDGKCQVLGCDKLFTGSLNATAISVRSIVEYALRKGAISIVLAHNHTSGLAAPSAEDIDVTEQLAKTLVEVEVLLVDHVVVSGTTYTSMVCEGLYRPPSLY